MGANISASLINKSVTKTTTTVLKDNIFKCHNSAKSTSSLEIGCSPCSLKAINVVARNHIEANSYSENGCNTNVVNFEEIKNKIATDIAEDIKQKGGFLQLNENIDLITYVENSVNTNITERVVFDCINAAYSEATLTVNKNSQTDNSCANFSIGLDIENKPPMMIDNPIIDGRFFDWKEKKSGNSIDTWQLITIEKLSDSANCNPTDIMKLSDGKPLSVNNFGLLLTPLNSTDDSYFQSIEEFKPYMSTYKEDKKDNIYKQKGWNLQNFQKKVIITYLSNLDSQCILTSFTDRKFKRGDTGMSYSIGKKLERSGIKLSDIKGIRIGKLEFSAKCQQCNPATAPATCINWVHDNKVISLAESFQDVSSEIKSLTQATNDITTDISKKVEMKGANIVFVILALVFLLIIIGVIMIIYAKFFKKEEFDFNKLVDFSTPTSETV